MSDADAKKTQPQPAELGPRAEKKCRQILDGARAVFLERGFDGASVDEIAERAGISKATMYRYYPDKKALFSAVVSRDCGRQADHMFALDIDNLPLEELLYKLAKGYIAFIVSPFAQGIYRIAVAESGRLPEIGGTFFNSGPDCGRRRLAPILAEAAARGEIDVDDPDHAAHQFFELCKAEVFYKTLFGLGGPTTEAEIDAKARATVAGFLHGCAKAPPAAG